MGVSQKGGPRDPKGIAGACMGGIGPPKRFRKHHFEKLPHNTYQTTHNRWYEPHSVETHPKESIKGYSILIIPAMFLGF